MSDRRTLDSLLREAGIASNFLDTYAPQPRAPLRRPARPLDAPSNTPPPQAREQGRYMVARQGGLDASRDQFLRGDTLGERAQGFGALAADLTGVPALMNSVQAFGQGDWQSGAIEGVMGALGAADVGAVAAAPIARSIGAFGRSAPRGAPPMRNVTPRAAPMVEAPAPLDLSEPARMSRAREMPSAPGTENSSDLLAGTNAVEADPLFARPRAGIEPREFSPGPPNEDRYLFGRPRIRPPLARREAMDIWGADVPFFRNPSESDLLRMTAPRRGSEIDPEHLTELRYVTDADGNHYVFNAYDGHHSGAQRDLIGRGINITEPEEGGMGFIFRSPEGVLEHGDEMGRVTGSWRDFIRRSAPAVPIGIGATSLAATQGPLQLGGPSDSGRRIRPPIRRPRRRD